jgi:mRNA interferase HigB
VRVISLKPLRDFRQRHPDAEGPLRLWYKTAINATWSGLHDLRRTYRDADVLTVFDIGGNKYRLIARIRYEYQLVNVRAVMTHKEYDGAKWKQ